MEHLTSMCLDKFCFFFVKLRNDQKAANDDQRHHPQKPKTKYDVISGTLEKYCKSLLN